MATGPFDLNKFAPFSGTAGDPNSITVTGTFNTFTVGIDASAKVMNDAITASALNPADPTNLIRMQAAMANYNMAMMVSSSLVKSVEETAKSITQKL